jgi:hypothetical protein
MVNGAQTGAKQNKHTRQNGDQTSGVQGEDPLGEERRRGIDDV